MAIGGGLGELVVLWHGVGEQIKKQLMNTKLECYILISGCISLIKFVQVFQALYTKYT